MNRIRSYVLLGIILAGTGGFGLFLLITRTLPFLRERWAFFFLVFIFLCGLGLPFFALLNRYFFTAKRIIPKTVLREAIGLSIMVDILLWFRMGRVLNNAIMFLCVGGFVAAEVLIRARETIEYREGYDKSN